MDVCAIDGFTTHQPFLIPVNQMQYIVYDDYSIGNAYQRNFNQTSNVTVNAIFIDFIFVQ